MALFRIVHVCVALLRTSRHFSEQSEEKPSLMAPTNSAHHTPMSVLSDGYWMHWEWAPPMTAVATRISNVRCIFRNRKVSRCS